MDNKYELYHHGVLGMKWGVRRYQNKDGSLTAAGRKRMAENDGGDVSRKKRKSLFRNTKKAVDVEEPKKKTIADLSDDELQKRIRRLQLEKQYKDLTKEEVPNISAGKEFVTSVLKKSGENLLPQVLNHFGAKALNKIIGEDVIFANNKKKS